MQVKHLDVQLASLDSRFTPANNFNYINITKQMVCIPVSESRVMQVGAQERDTRRDDTEDK